MEPAEQKEAKTIRGILHDLHSITSLVLRIQQGVGYLSVSANTAASKEISLSTTIKQQIKEIEELQRQLTDLGGHEKMETVKLKPPGTHMFPLIERTTSEGASPVSDGDAPVSHRLRKRKLSDFTGIVNT